MSDWVTVGSKQLLAQGGDTLTFSIDKYARMAEYRLQRRMMPGEPVVKQTLTITETRKPKRWRRDRSSAEMVVEANE